MNFFEGIVENMPEGDNEVSIELAEFFNKVLDTFNENTHILSGKYPIRIEKLS